MFNPNFYNPYMVGAPQTTYNTPNAPAQQQNTQLNVFAYVNGLEGAKAFFVPPNGRVLLMDSDNPVFYMKTANAMGQTSVRTFKFEEVQDQPAPKVDYVKQSDLTVFDVRIKRLEDILSGVKKNAESITEQQ